MFNFIVLLAIIIIAAKVFNFNMSSVEQLLNNTKAKGAANGANKVIDSLSELTKVMVRTTSEKVAQAKSGVANKVEQVQAPKSYRFDGQTGEMILLFKGQDDLVVGRDNKGLYAYTVGFGRERVFTQSGFERHIKWLQRHGHLSEMQERKLKDYIQLKRITLK